MTTRGGTLVAIGVGNVLLGDDGVGVRVIEALRRLSGADPTALPAGTRLVDGGTLGLGLLPEIEDANGLLLVDAVARGDAAGTVTVHRRGLPGEDAGADVADDPWRCGLGELLAVGRMLGAVPPEVAVVGIEAATLGPGVGLSAAVEVAIPVALHAAVQELQAMSREPAGARA